MTSCNRANSPVLKRHEGAGRRQRELIIDEGKIHRIVLMRPAICKLAHIQSPNCIWFKLANHITDQLQFHRPTSLKPAIVQKQQNTTKTDASKSVDGKMEEEPPQKSEEDGESGENPSTTSPTKPVAPAESDKKASSPPAPAHQTMQRYQYVMAPLREDVYARGRVIYLREVVDTNDEQRSLTFAYVHFIDEGFGDWMSIDCLAQMDRALYTHPWQAFPVALYKFKNGNGRNMLKDHQSEWPTGLTHALYRIMVDYTSFRVEPVWDSTRCDARNYWDYARANVYGLDADRPTEETNQKDGNSKEEEENEEGPEKRGQRQGQLPQRHNGRHDESVAHRLLLEFQMRGGGRQQQQMLKSDLPNGAASPSRHAPPPLSSLSSCLTRTIFDAKQQQLLREPDEELTEHVLASIPPWRLVKSNFFST